MKLSFNHDFWQKTNVVSRLFILVGAFLIDCGFKLSGFEQQKKP